MSTINNVADEALRQNMLLAQMSNASYNAINGTRQKERDFKEGILNMGKLDSQMDAPKDKITKEMIMDYKRQQEEKSYKSTFTRLVPQKDTTGMVMSYAGLPIMVEEKYEIPTIFQQTGLNPKLQEYKPLYTGEDIDEERQQKIYNTFVEEKNKLRKEFDELSTLRDYKSRQILETELRNGLLNIPSAVAVPFMKKLKYELKETERLRNEKLMEILNMDKGIKNQEKNIQLVKENVISNATERARVESENKQHIKEYGEKFNILNRDKTNVEKQPYETDEQYFRRIKDLERTQFDPYIYSDKAEIEERRKFKKNLGEILKDPAKIENIIKTFQRVEDIYIINNSWTKISNYLKTKYGVNNRFTTEKEYIDEIKTALKNIQSSTFNVSQITKNTPIPTNNTLILTNKANPNQKIYIKFWRDLVYYSENPNNAYTKLIYKDIDITLRGYNTDILGIHTTRNKLIENLAKKINMSKTDPQYQYPTPPIVGTGIKKGRGMQQIKENEEVTQAAEIQEIPKICNFGNKKILLNKLYYRNILSIKDKRGHSIEKLPNLRVSDDFVKIIMMLCDDKKPSIEAYTIRDNLEESEKELLSLVLFVTGINKNKNIDISKVDNVKKLKERLTLVESQIRAGNNNPVVKIELKEIVNKLYLYGAISYNHAKDYIKQF